MDVNSTNMSGKILYIFDAQDWDSRVPVAIAARDAGFEVVIGLLGILEVKNSAVAKDFKIISIKIEKKKFGGRGLHALSSVIREIALYEKPDILHAVTIKYAFAAGLACMQFKNMRKIYTLAGLGYLFRGGGKKTAFIRMVMAPMLKKIFSAAHTSLIFQNPDDMALIRSGGYTKKAKSVLIRGSGVDLSKFSPKPYTPDGSPIILMPTRLVHEKGVAVFVSAAKLLKQRDVVARFQIAGGLTQHNPRAITKAEMEDLSKDGAVEWLGRVENMPELLSKATLVVYPSYYGEGIPRVLLEALAAGRAIITTDHPGCRETVIDQENGFLVPVKDAQAVADGVEELIVDAGRLKAMGKASRALAEKEFSIDYVAAQTVDVYIQAMK